MGASVIWAYIELFGHPHLKQAVFVDQAPLLKACWRQCCKWLHANPLPPYWAGVLTRPSVQRPSAEQHCLPPWEAVGLQSCAGVPDSVEHTHRALPPVIALCWSTGCLAQTAATCDCILCLPQNRAEDWNLGSHGCYDAVSLARLQCTLRYDFNAVAQGGRQAAICIADCCVGPGLHQVQHAERPDHASTQHQLMSDQTPHT